MPDLEPVKIYLRQFDENMNEMKENRDRNEDGNVADKDDQQNKENFYLRKSLLVSQHLPLSKFSLYLTTLCMRLVPEASSASKATILIVNEDNIDNQIQELSNKGKSITSGP